MFLYGPTVILMRIYFFYFNRGEWWCVAFGFSMVIFIYDELRKWVIRQNPNGENLRSI